MATVLMRLRIGSGKVMVEEKHGELNFSYAIWEWLKATGSKKMPIVQEQ